MRDQPVGRLELSLLQRCGGQLAEVLAGRVEPLGLLFPAGAAGAGGAGEIYNESPLTRLLNGLVAAVLSGVGQPVLPLPGVGCACWKSVRSRQRNRSRAAGAVSWNVLTIYLPMCPLAFCPPHESGSASIPVRPIPGARYRG